MNSTSQKPSVWCDVFCYFSFATVEKREINKPVIRQSAMSGQILISYVLWVKTLTIDWWNWKQDDPDRSTVGDLFKKSSSIVSSSCFTAVSPLLGVWRTHFLTSPWTTFCDLRFIFIFSLTSQPSFLFSSSSMDSSLSKVKAFDKDSSCFLDTVLLRLESDFVSSDLSGLNFFFKD